MNCGEDCPSNEKDRNSLPCCNCERRNAIVKKEEEERKRMKENVKLRNRKAKMGDIQDIQKEIEILKNEMTDLKKMLQNKPHKQIFQNFGCLTMENRFLLLMPFMGLLNAFLKKETILII